MGVKVIRVPVLGVCILTHEPDVCCHRAICDDGGDLVGMGYVTHTRIHLSTDTGNETWQWVLQMKKETRVCWLLLSRWREEDGSTGYLDSSS